MNCPHCRAPLVDDARFCPACGKASSPTESASGSAWPAAGAPELVGKEIAGRYRLVSKLGEGGMGAVYRGEQISLKRAVAVKLLRPELSSNQMILRRFNAEAEAVAKLSHPNTVNIYDFGQDTDGSLFIAMEYIEGRSLRSAIQNEGPFAPARAIAIAHQVAASLSDAHSHQIVHRDLKPDNVMLQDRGRQKDVVRVLDFGIAKLRDDSRQTQAAMTQAGDMLGTPQYMAPEQIKGEAIDGRTDIYALGCMIYEMVTARLPYEAPTIMAMLSKHLMENPVPPTQRRPDLGIPAPIDQIVLAAMSKDASSRPATMEIFSEMLAGLLATLPPDPNRPQSAALSVQQAAVGAAVTPAALAAYAPTPAPFAPTPAPFAPTPAPFAPPAPPPGGFAPSPYMPPSGGPGHYAPQPIPPPPAVMAGGAPAKSRAALYVLLGVLVLGGAGVGVWAATRDSGGSGSSKPVDDPADPPTDPDDKPDEPDDPPDDPPDNPTDKADPWADKGAGKGGDTWADKGKSVGTAETPIPKGAYLVAPSGFSKMPSDGKAVAYADASRGLLVAMAPLLPGTNDPDELAKMWTTMTGATLITRDKVQSAGRAREGLAFKASVNGVDVAQVIVLYITDRYRLGVLFQVPVDQIQALQSEMDKFFLHNVHVP